MLRSHGSVTKKCPVVGCKRRRYMGGKCRIHLAEAITAHIREVEAAGDPRPDEGDYRYVPVEPPSEFNDPHLRADILRGAQ